jgi:hypothetical protein
VQEKNQRVSDMADAKSNTIERSIIAAPRRPNGGLLRSASFKYYIHDSVSTCRLQLLGELQEKDIAELNGCWQTIKTTLKNRQLVLDLRRLDSTDSFGNRWLVEMGMEGATYLPASYFSESQPAKEANEKGKLSPFARVLELLRGACAAGVD